MEKIEYLREKLHKAIEIGNIENILKASRELDKAIYAYMQKNLNLNKKSA